MASCSICAQCSILFLPKDTASNSYFHLFLLLLLVGGVLHCSFSIANKHDVNSSIFKIPSFLPTFSFLQSHFCPLTSELLEGAVYSWYSSCFHAILSGAPLGSSSGFHPAVPLTPPRLNLLGRSVSILADSTLSINCLIPPSFLDTLFTWLPENTLSDFPPEFLANSSLFPLLDLSHLCNL